MTTLAYQPYLAWDVPTRCFHWINALAVIGLIASGLMPFVTLHEFAFYALAIVILLHPIAVVLTELHEGGSITSAMFTGCKILTRKPPDAA